MFVGKDKCDYCKKSMKINNEIWRNRINKKVENKQFCSEDCAIKYMDKSSIKPIKEKKTNGKNFRIK